MEKNKKRRNEGFVPFVVHQYNETQVPTCVSINKDQFDIGRGMEMDLQIVNPKISRRHCRIKRVPGEDVSCCWRLIDLSTLGTFVNNRLVDKESGYKLNDGDIIYLAGPYSYPVHFHSQSDPFGLMAAAKRRRSTHQAQDDEGRESMRQQEDVKENSCYSVNENSIIVLSPPANGAAFGKYDRGYAIPSRHGLEPVAAPSQLSLESLPQSQVSSATQTDEIVITDISQEEPTVQHNVDLLNNKGGGGEECDRVTSLHDGGVLSEAIRLRESEVKNLKEMVEERELQVAAITYRMKVTNEIIDSQKIEMDQMKKRLADAERELADSRRENSEVVLLKASKDLTDTMESELQCCICNEIVYVATIILPCSHIFCKFCIETWAKRKKECAVCRTAIAKFVPCRLLDAFVEKIIEKLPDKEFQNHRKQFVVDRMNAVAAARASRSSSSRRRSGEIPVGVVMPAASSSHRRRGGRMRRVTQADIQEPQSPRRNLLEAVLEAVVAPRMGAGEPADPIAQPIDLSFYPEVFESFLMSYEQAHGHPPAPSIPPFAGRFQRQRGRVVPGGRAAAAATLNDLNIVATVDLTDLPQGSPGRITRRHNIR